MERVFVRIANQLHQTGAPVSLVVNQAVGPTRARLSPNIPVIALDAPRSRNALVPLTRLLATSRPAAVISALTYCNATALIANRLARRPARVVISERSHVSGVLTDYGAARRALTLGMIRRLYPQADAISAVSSGTADDLAALSGLDRGALHVLPNAPPDPADYAAARQAPAPHPWLLDGGGPVALAVGRLEPQKNHALALEALALVRRSGTALRLIILGDGSLGPDLRAQARALGIETAVSFAGFVDAPLAYLVNAQLFVMTSRWEGYPNALLEAAAAGLPCVSTDCAGGGARDILGPEALVPDDAEAIAAAMLHRLAEPEAARSAEPFPLTITVVAERYLALARGDAGSAR